MAVRLWLIGLLALLAGCADVSREPIAPVAATPQPACALWAQIRTTAPPTLRLVRVASPVSFLRGFNAMDPPSDVVADEVWIARRADVAHLFFVKQGCLVDRGAIPWAEAELLLGAES